jgi:hypothetical protein
MHVVGRYMQIARERPKSGGRELPFELSDCFLDNAICIQGYMQLCIIFLAWVPGNKIRHEQLLLWDGGSTVF